MPRFGLAIQLEHTGALEALDLARASRDAGFHGVVAADVIQPWVPPRDPTGVAPHLWTVLSAAASHITGPIGAVITPNFRHHPAVIAQASSTLATMYPKRHWLALSAGEAINDAVTGQAWPRPPERINAMFEAADMIRRLFLNSEAGKDTRKAGTYASVEGARLWTLPATFPPLLVAAAGPLTARRAGREVDGFITMGNSLDNAQRLLERFYQGVEESKRDPAQTLT
ncbi:MAG TPA: LLM class flavin-dependent oxidoreductase, partial [Beutenbergiaceae bacterium]|nr:LLM class flavin-dependent oxidoreductase [Beutenbergiaceae bacterium]